MTLLEGRCILEEQHNNVNARLSVKLSTPSDFAGLCHATWLLRYRTTVSLKCCEILALIVNQLVNFLRKVNHVT